MDREEMINTEDYDSLLKEVETNSPYKRLSSPAKKWMSVSEMGELLGLKKTDRYWLVHKNYFETKEFAGKMRINIESFEKWYANQIKYHKVNGEEPGKELMSMYRPVRSGMFINFYGVVFSRQSNGNWWRKILVFMRRFQSTKQRNGISGLPKL